MTDTTISHRGASVFADLETHLLKARLVGQMVAIVRERKLTQTQAARMMGIGQPDVSRLLKGQFRDVSVERILRLLTRLGCEIDIVVRPGGGTSGETVMRLPVGGANITDFLLCEAGP